MKSQQQYDLSRHLQAKIADVLIRETAIAQHVLDVPEVALTLIEASVMMVRTTAGTIANTVGDPSKVEGLVADALDAIVHQIRSSQPDIVAKVCAEIQQRSAA